MQIIDKKSNLSKTIHPVYFFSFAIKDCYSGLGKADPNAADNKKVQMLENFCRVTAFDEIITKDTGLLHDIKYKGRPHNGTKE